MKSKLVRTRIKLSLQMISKLYCHQTQDKFRWQSSRRSACLSGNRASVTSTEEFPVLKNQELAGSKLGHMTQAEVGVNKRVTSPLHLPPAAQPHFSSLFHPTCLVSACVLSSLPSTNFTHCSTRCTPKPTNGQPWIPLKTPNQTTQRSQLTSSES